MVKRILEVVVLCWIGSFLIGCGPTTFVVGLTPGDQTLESTVVQPAERRTRDAVAMIDVTGLIVNARQDGLLTKGENPVSTFREKLDKAAADRDVKAIVLRINSPGGGVTASEIMYRDLLAFKEQTGKPVVVLMMDVAASGGYYLACGGDHLVAYPSTITGSIGVIIQTISFHQALTSIGIIPSTITSGPNKDTGSPLSPMSDENRQVLQNLVDEFYESFVSTVREQRPTLNEQHIAEATDGRVVSGKRAQEIGLVDELGDLEQAFTHAKHLAGIADAKLILYNRPLDYVGSPYANSPVGGANTAGTEVNVLQLNLSGDLGGLNTPPGFYYLWRP